MKMMVNRSNEKCKLKNWTLIYISNELSKYKEGANSDQVFLRERTLIGRIRCVLQMEREAIFSKIATIKVLRLYVYSQTSIT